MSTSYYALKEPFTSIRVGVFGTHTHVGIWVNHAKSGTLVFRNEEWIDAWNIFRSNLCLLHRHAGRDGVVLTDNVRPLDSERVIISEGGEVTTVGEVRRQCEGGPKQE